MRSNKCQRRTNPHHSSRTGFPLLSSLFASQKQMDWSFHLFVAVKADQSGGESVEDTPAEQTQGGKILLLVDRLLSVVWGF